MKKAIILGVVGIVVATIGAVSYQTLSTAHTADVPSVTVHNASTEANVGDAPKAVDNSTTTEPTADSTTTPIATAPQTSQPRVLSRAEASERAIQLMVDRHAIDNNPLFYYYFSPLSTYYNYVYDANSPTFNEDNFDNEINKCLDAVMKWEADRKGLLATHDYYTVCPITN